jgi:hypothetical protein
LAPLRVSRMPVPLRQLAAQGSRFRGDAAKNPSITARFLGVVPELPLARSVPRESAKRSREHATLARPRHGISRVSMQEVRKKILQVPLACEIRAADRNQSIVLTRAGGEIPRLPETFADTPPSRDRENSSVPGPRGHLCRAPRHARDTRVTPQFWRRGHPRRRVKR